MILSPHPYADKFPMLPEGELQELAESIRENGLRQPVVVTPDGLILDGRNRAAACDLIGVEPETVVYDGEDLAEYVIDSNVTRRNMSTGARAMATALVLEADGRRGDGRWRRGSVHITASRDTGGSTWTDALRQAGIVLDWTPDKADAVTSGDLPLKVAYVEACQARDKVDAEKRAKAIEANRKREATIREREENTRKLATLTEENSPYLAKVQAEEMSIAAAYAAHLADTEKQRKAEQEQERTRRDMAWTIAESVRHLNGGAKSANTFLREVYPHEAKYLQPEVQLTRVNLNAAIEYLQALKGSVTQ